jgi:hypothetical protein
MATLMLLMTFALGVFMSWAHANLHLRWGTGLLGQRGLLDVDTDTAASPDDSAQAAYLLPREDLAVTSVEDNYSHDEEGFDEDDVYDDEERFFKGLYRIYEDEPDI